MLLAGPPEDRLAGDDRLAGAVVSAHLAGAFQDSQDLRIGGGMAGDPPTSVRLRKIAVWIGDPSEIRRDNGATVTPSRSSSRGANAASGAKLNRSN